MIMKLLKAIIIFLVVFIPLGFIGLTVIFLYFGPHASHQSGFIALLIASVCFAVPGVLAYRTYKNI